MCRIFFKTFFFYLFALKSCLASRSMISASMFLFLEKRFDFFFREKTF